MSESDRETRDDPGNRIERAQELVSELIMEAPNWDFETRLVATTQLLDIYRALNPVAIDDPTTDLTIPSFSRVSHIDFEGGDNE